ncbi:hypothetical protein F5X99DRAFT_403913 [Biscogniauxia marginata]|nr:hypothetical protein F5X99DRAFT_403913 [Biscogniauxia marginata]
MASSLLDRGAVLSKRSPGPVAEDISSIVLSVTSISVLSCFITQRSLAVKSWRRLPFIVWLAYAILVDSWIFVFVTAILHFGVGFNSSLSLIYLFLVEKAFIIQGGTRGRLQSKLYIFNSFGLLTIYVVISILNFVYRITRMENGECIIGMKNFTMIPDCVRCPGLPYCAIPYAIIIMYGPNFPRTKSTPRLQTVAMKTFIGTLCTTMFSVANLTVLMALDGEPGWPTVLLSAIVIQWVTTTDNPGTKDGSENPTYPPQLSIGDGGGSPEGGGTASSSTPPMTLVPSRTYNPSPAMQTPEEEFRRMSSKYGIHDDVDVTAFPLRNVASDVALVGPSRTNSNMADEQTLGSGDLGDAEEGPGKGHIAAVVTADVAHIRPPRHGGGDGS